MDNESTRGSASFITQANALLRKNIAFQRRNIEENTRIISYPIIIILVLFGMQKLINTGTNNPEFNCGCTCIGTSQNGSCSKLVCGIQYSNPGQAFNCPVPKPSEWPALVQVPRIEFRASYDNESGPAVLLFTGDDQFIAKGLAGNIFISIDSSNFLNNSNMSSSLVLGTDTNPVLMNILEPAFVLERPLYFIQPSCYPNSTLTLPFRVLNSTNTREIKCVQGLTVWRENYREINDELFKGYRQGNPKGIINEFISAIDYSDSGKSNYNVTIWYNSTFRDNITTQNGPFVLKRVPRSVNMVSNSYLQFFHGAGIEIELEFTKEMPKQNNRLTLDFLSLLSPSFYVCIIELLLPIMLTYLVYEKQHKLRTMMQMHGLGDGAYWFISYVYFFVISSIYLILMVVSGLIMGLNFFKLNDYSIQFVFYFIVMNLQILLAFIFTSIFSTVRIAQAIMYIYIFGCTVLAGDILQVLIEDPTVSRHWIWILEIIPSFSLYGGLYELSEYAFDGHLLGTTGMNWSDLNNNMNGMKAVLIINILEWLFLLPIAYYIDKITSIFGKLWKYILDLKGCYQVKNLPIHSEEISSLNLDIEKPDIIKEKEMVELLLREPSVKYAIICDKLRKIYSEKDGNHEEKIAVQNVSLAVSYGECFGLLGPNGAGKTTLINMLCGSAKPTSGNAYIHGLNIENNMDKIYTGIGVCPQKDMLWEILTGKEHLLFYGRLKNLKGSQLINAVDESLRSLDLHNYGNEQVKKYSGGMKRRLSVAISLIGNPKVVYLDEPSTGLDPASRKKLWNVVKQAKKKCAIILTTHSMEEAEFLCDRLGIIVNGSLQCIGSPKELKARYGESYVFTITTSPQDETKAMDLIKELSPNSNKIYGMNGNQRFEIPKKDVTISRVFQAVEMAKRRLEVREWSLADTNMEDVFIKVAKGAESSTDVSS